MENRWWKFVESHKNCVLCKNEGLLDSRSFPLFAKQPPRSYDILFILEAPNPDDTYNPQKGYITVDSDTDPSGKFFYELFTEKVKFSIEDLFITNSVLCLPARKAKKNPVSSQQRNNCKEILRKMIDIFDPVIVCPLGKKALDATSQIYRHAYWNMAEAAANPSNWYGRILFPLYHTGLLARKPPYGRSVDQQRNDWKKLCCVWEQARKQKSF
jgi:uracil-DNA glycosylase family 4